MFKSQKFNYAVFGNPIKHSKSPKIHNFFSNQTSIMHNYKAVNVPLNNLSITLSDFFMNDGQGANITAPFKQEAYFFCHQLTQRAKIAQSVNTLKKINTRCILGDNTDGIGLLSDLIRLNFIKKDFSILIIGSGGAVRGILAPLLSFRCSVFILNRTLSKAEKLVLQFQKYGKINLFNKNLLNKKYFDLIINATSKNIQDINDLIPLSLISEKTCFYDINYQKDDKLILHSRTNIPSTYFSNGIGMLVFQAAHSFFLWHNIFPEIDYIIDVFNK